MRARIFLALVLITSTALCQDNPSDKIISDLKESLSHGGLLPVGETFVSKDVLGDDEVSLTGPTEPVTPGDTTFLRVKAPDGAIVNWILGNSNKQFFAFENNRVCVFGTATQGTYKFFAVVAGGDPLQQVVLSHDLVVGSDDDVIIPDPPDPPDPPIPPPDPPEPNEWVDKLKSFGVDKKPDNEVQALASAFKEYSTRVKEFTGGTNFSVATMAKFKATVGGEVYAEWESELRAFAEAVNELKLSWNEDGRDFAKLWTALSEALETILAGVEDGPRFVVIIDDVDSSTAARRDLLSDIRNYMDDQEKHRLFIGDDDRPNQADWLEDYIDVLDGNLPGIVIADLDTGTLLHKGALPSSLTAFQTLLEEHGG